MDRQSVQQRLSRRTPKLLRPALISAFHRLESKTSDSFSGSLDADVIFGTLIARKLVKHKIKKSELGLWQIFSNWVLSRVLYLLFKLTMAVIFVVGWAMLVTGFLAAIYGLAEAMAFARHMGWIG